MWWEPLFYACNFGVLPLWALLVFAPRWRWTDRIVSSGFVPLLYGAAYIAILFTDRNGNPDGSFVTLDGIAALFESRQTVAAAWIHYLVFDLFVGAWEVRDARRHGIPHLAVVPCLIATFMFGPTGLFAYVALRAALKKRFRFEERDREEGAAAA